MAANPVPHAGPPAGPADFRLVHPEDYAHHGYPHHVWARLRAEEPVSWVTQPGNAVDFWAITKHADITEIGKNPEAFLSGPRLVVQHIEEDPNQNMPKTLIQMDPPMHGEFRQMISRRFTPRMLQKIHDPIEKIGRDIVENLYQRSNEGECDFVDAVAAPLPIAVIGWLLGVPEEDWQMLFDWTNRTLGAGDPDFQEEGSTPRETADRARIELFTYFSKMIQDRRANPQDDLITVFTQSEYQGKPLNDLEVSRRHSVIEVFGRDMLYVRDLGSTNGTYHNGRRVQVARIRPGDTVGCGKTVMKLLAG